MTVAFLITMLILALFAVGWLYLKVGQLRRRAEQLQQRGRRIQQQLQNSSRQQQLENDGREAVEDRLRRYLTILDTLINTIPHPIYYKDRAGVFRGCNEAFANDILGMPRSGIIDRRGRDLGPEAPPELVRELRRQELKLAARNHALTSVATVKCANNRSKDYLISLATIPAETEHGSGCVGVLLDMTDRNRATEERIQREKFQGVIETAGAVCHEFNQPLQALTGYAEMLWEEQSDHPDLKRIISTIQSQVGRMAEITGKLQRITAYKTQAYGENATIIDIHKASQPSKPIRDRSSPGN